MYEKLIYLIILEDNFRIWVAVIDWMLAEEVISLEGVLGKMLNKLQIPACHAILGFQSFN